MPPVAPTPPRYFDEADLDALGVRTCDVIESIENCMQAQIRGRAWSAPKSSLQLPDGRYVMSTLAVSDEPAYVVVKSLALNPANPDHGLPLMNALVTLLDSATGLPLAVMDGNWITAVRTAGLSAVAAKYLARPDSAVITFVGCGVQAHAHLRAFADCYPLREVRALGRGVENRDRLCSAARAIGLHAVPCDDARAALDGADLIVTAVTHAIDFTPFLDAGWVAPGAFAAITDLARPWRADTMDAFQRIIIDDLAQEAVMTRPMVDPARVVGDIGALVNGDVPPRRDDAERTAFVYRGMAIGDLAVAGLAHRIALRRDD